MDHEALLKYSRELYQVREDLNKEISRVDEELYQMEQEKIQNERLT